MLCSLNSTLHFCSRPDASGLEITCLMGWSDYSYWMRLEEKIDDADQLDNTVFYKTLMSLHISVSSYYIL